MKFNWAHRVGFHLPLFPNLGMVLSVTVSPIRLHACLQNRNPVILRAGLNIKVITILIIISQFK
jgi:hypothetical protein